MEFAKLLEKWGVPEIVSALGCPARIVYAWKAGEKQPRPWVQRLILGALLTAKRK